MANSRQAYFQIKRTTIKKVVPGMYQYDHIFTGNKFFLYQNDEQNHNLPKTEIYRPTPQQLVPTNKLLA